MVGHSPASISEEQEQAPQVREEEEEMGSEIPFVPASQRRHHHPTPPDTDTVVMVGKKIKTNRRQRGRTTTTATTAATSKDQQDQQDQQEEFDFTSVSNLLDVDDDHPTRPVPVKKKQKKASGQGRSTLVIRIFFLKKTLSRSLALLGGPFSGHFPAPPRAYRELRGGNQSHTFK